MENIEKYKLGVPNTFLLFLAGIVWCGVGLMLIIVASSWLSVANNFTKYLFTGAGIFLALFVHHFGFLKIVDKNLKRIHRMEGKRCLFSFIPWKSYLTIIIMITFGYLLRHSIIPKPDLAILYIGIGLALVLSSIRYVRIFVREIKSH